MQRKKKLSPTSIFSRHSYDLWCSLIIPGHHSFRKCSSISRMGHACICAPSLHNFMWRPDSSGSLWCLLSGCSQPRYLLWYNSRASSSSSSSRLAFLDGERAGSPAVPVPPRAGTTSHDHEATNANDHARRSNGVVDAGRADRGRATARPSPLVGLYLYPASRPYPTGRRAFANLPAASSLTHHHSPRARQCVCAHPLLPSRSLAYGWAVGCPGAAACDLE